MADGVLDAPEVDGRRALAPAVQKEVVQVLLGHVHCGDGRGAGPDHGLLEAIDAAPTPLDLVLDFVPRH